MQEQKEQIGRNSQKFVPKSYEIRTNLVRISCEFHISRKFTQIYSRKIRTNFVRISYEFHISRIFTQIYSREIRAKFVRNSYEFHVNFVQFANTQSKHTSKHTLQSHG